MAYMFSDIIELWKQLAEASLGPVLSDLFSNSFIWLFKQQVVIRIILYAGNCAKQWEIRR